MMIVGRVIVILKKHYKPRQKKRRTDRITNGCEPYASTGKSQVKARAITTSLKNLSPTIGIYAND
jgi:hypothetical protein